MEKTRLLPVDDAQNTILAPVASASIHYRFDP
jgi:hypothetical protein